MSIQIESDLKDILAKFEIKLDKLEQKIDNIQKDISEIKVELATVKTKVDGVTDRLNSIEFLNRGVVIGLLLAIIGGLAKLFGVVGNP